MPTTRRSMGTTRGRITPTGGQSTISFANKVTKPVPKDAKKTQLDRTATNVVLPERQATHHTDEIILEEDLGVVASEEVHLNEDSVAQKSEAELNAEKVSDSQVEKYWKAIEKQRIAPRVHQEGITLGEKVLRYFDVSSQYGGIEE